MRVDRMLGRHDRGFLDVLDDAPPLVAGRTDRPAAVGAASQRVRLSPINPKRRPPVFVFVSGFLSAFLGALLRGGLLVGRDLGRRFRDFASGLGGGCGLRESAQFQQRPCDGFRALRVDFRGLFGSQIREVFVSEFSGHADNSHAKKQKSSKKTQGR